ncbi:MAG: tRNA uridine-5-carboxymethylaminomethyl(34) synthesis GTPase MnmE [Bacillota bacterium]
MKDENSDTIVAVSTPPGQGGIGIIRMSGSASYEVAHRIFVRGGRGNKLRRRSGENFNYRPRQLYYGYIVDEAGMELDEVLISFMPAPHTYTCEDVVEINAHGGAVPLGNILNLILGMGVRLAEPGEFTKRAFLNGRIDLVQAESVLSIINARTTRGLFSSLQGLKGFLSQEMEEMGQELLDLRAAIEVDADFPLEDVEPADYKGLRVRVEKLRNKALSLHRRSAQGRILQEGLKTVIAGKPNVGKSSLYNYLLHEDRAIVTAVPGTTRDLLTDYVNLRGVPLRLMDTAGLRRDGDTVERIGMDYSRRAIEAADLLLFMVDLAGGIDREDMWIYENLPHVERQELIIIGNKIDRELKVTPEELEKLFPGKRLIKTSVVTGEGMADLEEAIVKTAFSGEVGGEEGALVMAARQAALIEEIVACLEDAVSALGKNLPLDLVAVDLQQAYEKLQNLLGEELPADILDQIFSKFCIGK